jgi:hypothetical protein
VYTPASSVYTPASYVYTPAVDGHNWFRDRTDNIPGVLYTSL